MTSAASPPGVTRPRVLFISSHAQRGGAEGYLLRLLELLADRIEPQVVALEEGPLVAQLGDAGVRVTVVPAGRRGGLATAARPLRRVLTQRGVDVVHANGVKAAVVSALATRGRRERLLWVKHDHSWDGPLVRAVARRCDLVVGVSRSVLAATAGTAVDARVVPPGVDVREVSVQDARRALRAAIGAPMTAPVVVGVGRLDPAKGFDDAIDALALVRAIHLEARLALVGGDDPKHPGEAARLRARADAAGLGGAVHLLGFREDAQDLLAGADVAAVTSRAVDARGMGREGFGLVAVEALAHGVPVVAYADGAVPEVVGEAGTLVAPRDVVALADAVTALLSDSARRERFAAAGRERARRFSSPEWAEAMLSVYVELAGRNGARASRRHPPGSGRTS